MLEILSAFVAGLIAGIWLAPVTDKMVIAEWKRLHQEQDRRDKK